jgi:hypothetical protein
MGKLFTRVINNRLNKWAEKYNVYIESQAGLRSKMGTVDNVFVLYGLINHFLNENKKIYACFVDFTKAFDLLVRENIWLKLIQIGVRGKILNVLKSMYQNVKSRVKTNSNTLSESFLCSLGVRQGDCLSPFLFSIYVNDIENTLSREGFKGIDTSMLKLFLLLYADDIVILAESLQDLQKRMDILKDYCKRWKLTVNINKTKVMIFKKGGRLPRNTRVIYDGSEIEIMNKFTYLGIVFSCGGSFEYTYEALSGQALKAIFKLKQYLQKFTNIDIKHKIDLFDKLIKPILCYGGEIWGMNNATKIENVHLHFLKNILGVKVQTQNNFIYGELGRMPLKQHRIVQVLKYWIKIIRSDDIKLTKQTYNLMLDDIGRNQRTTNWATSVRTILGNLGLNYAWIFQEVGNENIFITEVKRRLNDTFIQNWSSEIDMSTRADTYKLFASFGYAKYLEHINIHKYRISLTRFRLSAHRLCIETGRWHKPNPIPRNERKCILCNMLEDEYHFLFECELYKDLRIRYIKQYYRKRPNILKFIELITSERKRENMNLSVYVFKAMERRSALLY